jgi:hypothetical protein
LGDGIDLALKVEAQQGTPEGCKDTSQV